MLASKRASGAAMALEPGTPVGPYELQALLGRGAMGGVYRAVHRALGVPHALRVVSSDLTADPDFVQRFQDEARRAILLQHPNIAKVYVVGEDHGQWYVASELCEGFSLLDMIRMRGCLDLDAATPLLTQIASALDYVHQAGIVNLDLKPSNVVVRADGRATLIESGLWRALRTPQSSSRPATNPVVGTPEYMAPELLRGEPERESVDLYALGVLAYQLLVGRLPFESQNPLALFQAHLNQAPPPPRAMRPDLPLGAEQALLRQLAKSPSDRFPTASAFAAALDQASGPHTPWGSTQSAGPPVSYEGTTTAIDLDSPSDSPGGSAPPSPDGSPWGGPPPLTESRWDSQAEPSTSHTGQLSPLPPFGDSSGPATPPRPPESPAWKRSPPAGASAPPMGTPTRGSGDTGPSRLGSPFRWLARQARRVIDSLDPPASQPAPGAGGPVFPGGASTSSHAAGTVSTGLPEERLLARLPAPTESTTRTVAHHGTDIDDVHCSVFAPPRVARSRVFLVQVIAHRPAHAGMARQIAVEHDLTASSRGVAHLAIEVPPGATLGFELRMRELEVLDDAHAMTIWRGQPAPVTFEVRVPEAQRLGVTTGRLLVSWDGLTIGDIRFQVDVVEVVAAHEPLALEPSGISAQRFEHAFISYASSDRVEVLKRVQGLRLAGIQCFQDVLDLEPGQRWERELYRRIDDSDLFYLFWSRAARDSEWVRKEVAYALQRRGDDEEGRPLIKPIPLEAPSSAPPPPELAHLHFDDVILFYIEAQRARQARGQEGTGTPT